MVRRTNELEANVKAAHRKLVIANRQVEQQKAQINLLQRQRNDQAHRVAGDKTDFYIRRLEEQAFQSISPPTYLF
jgi:hypothetical protein